ncbi:MAG: glycosyltransferase family 39 protein [Anaerolineae bacterium]|nr:glycosyltransferase family 39 protein [Anaerolineae bacterium]
MKKKLGIVLVCALLLRVLLCANVVVFDSDEAIVGLMARHIVHGERPVFFYGQAYMGSLDAYLVAGLFALFAPTVWAIRIVQVALFLIHVALTFVLARRWSQDSGVAVLSALLMAFPPLTLTLYTTVALGGYGETLVFGDLVLLVGWTLATQPRPKLWRWELLGFLGGLGFWTLGLSVVYLLPTGLFLLWRHRARAWRGYLVAAVAFIVGSSPWWIYNIQHQWQAVLALYNPADAVGPLSSVLPMHTRVLGLFLIGLPGLIGARFPWSVEWVSAWAVPIVVMVYAAVALHAFGKARRDAWHGAYRLLWGIVLSFVALFIVSRFGSDPTGRYFLPLYTPLAIFTASALVAVGKKKRWAGTALLVLLLAFNLWGIWKGATSDTRITAQYNPQLQYGNTFDDELIAFLTENGGTRGYTHYWIAFKVAFLSDERVILTAHLPNKSSGYVNQVDNRYLPYVDMVSWADRVVYVTGNQPELDTLLREGFKTHGITYREHAIGPYRVFYDLSSPLAPSELDPRW